MDVLSYKVGPRGKKCSTYDKPKFGESENNIYYNNYRETIRAFSGSWNVLIRWKGSVYKLIWHDLFMFIVIYFLLAILYRTVLVHYPEHKQYFDLMCIYAERVSTSLPTTLLTGFFVTSVVSRWWEQFMALPYPDRIALKLIAFVPGNSHYMRKLRRTIMRYVNVSSILAFTNITRKLRNQYPNYQSFIGKKLLLPHEVDRLRSVDEKTPHESSWTPLWWAMKLLTRAREAGKIKIEPPVFANLQSTFLDIEEAHRKLLSFGWVNFPLAYTQVAHIAVFAHFGAALFGKQFLIPPKSVVDSDTFPNATQFPYASEEPYSNHTPDHVFPVFTVIELICFLGWIKVAECLLNPYGDDDEDFNINYLINRNLEVSYLIVDDVDEEFEKMQDASIDNERRCSFLNIPSFDDGNKMEKSYTSTVETVMSDISLDIDNVDDNKRKRNVIV